MLGYCFFIKGYFIGSMNYSKVAGEESFIKDKEESSKLQKFSESLHQDRATNAT